MLVYTDHHRIRTGLVFFLIFRKTDFFEFSSEKCLNDVKSAGNVQKWVQGQKLHQRDLYPGQNNNFEKCRFSDRKLLIFRIFGRCANKNKRNEREYCLYVQKCSKNMFLRSTSVENSCFSCQNSEYSHFNAFFGLLMQWKKFFHVFYTFSWTRRHMTEPTLPWMSYFSLFLYHTRPKCWLLLRTNVYWKNLGSYTFRRIINN